METGTISGKDKFLKRLSNRMGREEAPASVSLPAWSKRPQDKVLEGASQDELVDVLIAHSRAIHTDVVTSSSQDLEKFLQEAVSELGGGPIVCTRDERFSSFGLGNYLDREEKNGSLDVWEEGNRKDSLEVAEKANIGITFSDVTLAESGTVVLFRQEGIGRSVSLLPENYIAIIPKSTLVPRMTQAAKIIRNNQQDGQMPSCINFISGPSNSADIELRLVVGVHGPVKVIYIVVEDA